MSPIVLTWTDQLAYAGIWMLTIITAYLRGSLHERNRHITTLENQLAFLKGLAAERTDP